MPTPVRRAVAGLAGTGRWLLGVAGVAVVFCLVGIVVALFDEFAEDHPSESTGLCILVVLTVCLFVWLNRAGKAGALRRHAREAGWTEVDPASRAWPWTDLCRRGTVTVSRAWSLESGGFPITAGEIAWSDNALSGAVSGIAGKGVFVILHLASPMPSMALRLPFVRVGDSPLLDDPDMHTEFLRGLIPPWTLRGGELFTFHPATDPLTGEQMSDAVQRTLRIAGLLALSGAAGPPSGPAPSAG